MFQFPGCPPYTYGFSARYHTFNMVGFPIRKSPDLCLFAAPRCLSQLIASFVGNQCQGIHPVLLLA